MKQAAGACALLPLSMVFLQGVDAWTMRTVTSYQARVETYAPVWDADNQVFVSGMPHSLLSGGNATFEERYRASMDSVTTSSVEGALMYLQRDCIDRGADPTDDSVSCQRKNNVSVITFLEVQIVQPNAALAEYQEQRYMYPEFCPFVVMEAGECAYADEQDDGEASSEIGSGRQHPPECNQFNGLNGQPNIGPCVGAQAFSADMVAPYYDTIWFSYPNSCVASSWTSGKSDACREQYPGGLCPFGTDPDGVKCTFSYKILGYLSIDQLVGITAINASSITSNATESVSGSSLSISSSGSEAASSSAIGSVLKASTKYYKNYNAFCKAGNVEFHSYDQDKTLGLNNVTSIPFWKYPSSLEDNIARTQQMIALYNELADESSNHMQQLPTELDALRDANPPCYENAEACYNAQFGCRRHSYAQVCSVCRGQRDLCVRQISSYTFPELGQASRTVSDSELRSGIFATLAAQTAATSSTSRSTSGSSAVHAGMATSALALQGGSLLLLVWMAMH
ncbi:hypothetical protein PHYPSEUDO_010447 [Phytophthora pseudosyringae]|uniref:Uncharacterized protein n=1 Tax=Phytophthora pseudosyringae TaxID=221518 RepID=A0A8T1VDK7_9STRA|nr:hypothetical protein PHYPSEUDO_010447 [Phytophthora pseudosyringae]